MADGAPLIAVRDVHFSYDSRVPVLHGLNLTLGPGEFVALVGPNGSGKTTLGKHLNGLLHPSSGAVLVAGEDTRRQPIGELARTVGFVFQNPDHQIFLPSVAEEVAYGPRNLGIRGGALHARVSEALERFGLGGVRDQHPTLLGRGLRRRVALAAVYAMQPEVLVLDEPTGGLDQRATSELMALLQEMVAAGRTVVLITHDMRLVAEHARRMVVLLGGRVLGDGPPAKLLADQTLLAAADITPPPVVRLATDLSDLGMPQVLSVEAFSEAFLRLLREQGRRELGERTQEEGLRRERGL